MEELIKKFNQINKLPKFCPSCHNRGFVVKIHNTGKNPIRTQSVCTHVFRSMSRTDEGKRLIVIAEKRRHEHAAKNTPVIGPDEQPESRKDNTTVKDIDVKGSNNPA